MKNKELIGHLSKMDPEGDVQIFTSDDVTGEISAYWDVSAVCALPSGRDTVIETGKIRDTSEKDG